MDMINPNRGSKERLSQLFVMNGKNRERWRNSWQEILVQRSKLKATFTNNTLNSLKNPDDVIEPIQYPEPKFRVAVKAKTQNDDEKLGAILTEINKWIPLSSWNIPRSSSRSSCMARVSFTLTLQNGSSRTWRRSGLSSLHLRSLTVKRSPNLRNQPTGIKKQSGGAGQFGEVYMLIGTFQGRDERSKPNSRSRGRDVIELDWGGKLLMHNCIVGGAIDTRFMPAILKGIMEKIEEGPLTGSYAVISWSAFMTERCTGRFRMKFRSGSQDDMLSVKPSKCRPQDP